MYLFFIYKSVMIIIIKQKKGDKMKIDYNTPVSSNTILNTLVKPYDVALQLFSKAFQLQEAFLQQEAFQREEASLLEEAYNTTIPAILYQIGSSASHVAIGALELIPVVNTIVLCVDRFFNNVPTSESRISDESIERLVDHNDIVVRNLEQLPRLLRDHNEALWREEDGLDKPYSCVQRILCNDKVTGYFIVSRNFSDTEIMSSFSTVLIKIGDKVHYKQHNASKGRNGYKNSTYTPKTDNPFGEFFTGTSEDEVFQEKIETSQAKTILLNTLKDTFPEDLTSIITGY